jgi:integrase/recombinase XerD
MWHQVASFGFFCHQKSAYFRTSLFLKAHLMKVTAVLKGRIDSNGHQPIQIRIAEGRKRSFHPTGIKVAPELWDKKARKVKKEHPKAAEYNKDLERLIIQWQAKALDGAVKKVPKVDLYEYIETCMAQWDRVRSDGTHRQNATQREKLKAFAPTLLLSDITPEWLYKYQSYLYGLGNEGNTVWSSFKFVRKVVLKAFNEGVIKDNPFAIFPMPQYKDPKKVYLVQSEVDKVDEYLRKEECPRELVHIGTWFLIACYTGLRVSDLRAFEKRKHIVSGRLIVHTQKTEEIVSLPLSERVKGYLERVAYKPLGMTTENYNRLLKALMLACGIHKRVSSHTARHTFGTMAARLKISQEVTAKLMGHKNIKTTGIYYQIENNRIDEEYGKLS